ncbi:hypothetical protein [Reichenbachiella versicolor]|uniref:hypothetical protein n=1 Tax=Reichenbachiella versicolor TaxID=1821036 RepID=UPI000D6EA231|nr:hypothetical protein [Reichenbachiella versicolor]
MLRQIIALLSVFIIIFFSSCVSTHYGVGNFSHDTDVLQKPVDKEGEKERVQYITGKYNHSQQPVSNKFKSQQMGSMTYHLAENHRWYKIAGGGFLHGGSIDAISRNQVPGGHKYFLGGGLTGEFAVNIPAGMFEWRIIGVKMTALYENGKYNQFRKDVVDYPENGQLVTDDDEIYFEFETDLNPRGYNYNIGFTSEMVLQFDKVGIAWAVILGGGTGGSITAGSRWLLTYDKFTFSFNNQHRGALFETDTDTYYGFGLTYAFSRKKL